VKTIVRSTATLALSLALAACAPSAPPKAEPKTDDDKTVYAIGVAISKSLEVFNFSPAEVELVLAGVRDGVAKKELVKLEEKQMDIQKLALARRDAASAGMVAKGNEYLEKAAKEAGAVKTASGLIYIPVKEGAGAQPGPTDQVKVLYTGKLVDGTVFDSSAKHGGQPATFPLNGVIPCWGEGVQKMKVGGKARLVCPPAIAYGDQGAGGAIPPKATLDFEVELIEIAKTPAAAPQPAAPAPKKK
jgi:FKBP-type peptidyl-prolyl cis-trans isomerase FkpA